MGPRGGSDGRVASAVVKQQKIRKQKKTIANKNNNNVGYGPVLIIHTLNKNTQQMCTVL